MAGKEESEKQMGVGEGETSSRVQAEQGGIAIGGIRIGGDLSGSFTVGYTAEQVSLLLTQISLDYQRKPFDGRCPYKGLEVFEEEDAEFFFGRESLLADLVKRLKESRTLFISGPSGSGKSSLVRAGLIHSLKQGAIETLHSERWLFESMKPGREPLKDLALAFSRLKSPDLANYFLEHSGEINVLNDCAESALSGRPDQRFVLFVDQFEEVFTQVNREEERRAFLEMLAHAAAVENGRVIVLIAMRSDFLSNCAAYPALNALLNRQFVQIGSMQPEELVSAIALPALQVGLPVEDELIARIINDMKGEPGALPLMQFALKDLFEAQQARGGLLALRLEDYLRQGGIHRALERHADVSFARLSAAEQELARAIFRGLIEIGPGRQDTRRTALFEELVPADTDPALVQPVVQRLADSRLVITDEQAGKDTVTISHEILIDAWPWLKKLVEENREGIALQNEIANDANDWEDHRRDPSYLYSGGRLARAREQRASRKLMLGEVAQQFVQAGRARQQRGQRILIGAVSAVIVLLVIAVFSFRNQAEINIQTANTAQAASTFAVAQQVTAQANAEIAGQQSRLAQEQTQIALIRQLAAQAVARLNDQPDLALLLSAEAFHRWDAVETRDSLLTALLYSPDLVAFMRNPDDFASGEVSALAFSPDGNTLAVGSGDGNLALWDLGSRQMSASLTAPILQSKGGSYSATDAIRYRSDRQTLEVVSPFGEWSSIDLKTQKAVGGRMVGDEGISAIEGQLSLDGKTAAVYTFDNIVYFFDMTSRRIVGQLPASDLAESGYIRFSMGLSPNGKLFAVSYSGYDLSLWDVTTLQQVGVLRQAPDPSGSRVPDLSSTPVGDGPFLRISSIAFSPDGKLLATGDQGGAITLWSLSLLQPITQSPSRGTAAPRNRIRPLVFSPDGQTLAAARETILELWHVNLIDNALEPVSFPSGGHPVAVETMAFSPDGRLLATGGRDGKTILWDLTGSQAFGSPSLGGTSPPPASERFVGLSPDGKEFMTLNGSTVTVWNTTTGEKLSSLTLKISSGTFRLSPDGTTLAVPDVDINKSESRIQLWDLRTGKSLGTGSTQMGVLMDMEFAPDGKSLASAYLSGDFSNPSLLLWDLPTGQVRNVDSIKNPYITALAFHPDGKKLYLTANNGLLEMDLATQAVTSLATGSFDVIAVSPDGALLAADGPGNSIMLWNTGNRQAFGKALVGHTDQITSLAFNEQGTLLASGGQDGVRLWDVATGQLLGPRLTGALASQVAFAQSQEHASLFSDAGGIRQWPIDDRAWSDRACQIANRNLTQAEWETYFGEEPYRKTCPGLPVPLALVQVLIDSGARLASQGQIQGAIQRYQTALNLAPDFRAPAATLNVYCWFGSLYGFASEVLPYCEQAVQAAPEDFAIRDSRGLARALTGDSAGAMDDFQFFVERAAGAGYPEQSIQQRRQWIADLEAGRNPFTPELLEQLKGQ